jgi:hypothetical protein
MMSGIQWLYEATYRTKTKRKFEAQKKIGIPGARNSKLSGNCCKDFPLSKFVNLQLEGLNLIDW